MAGCITSDYKSILVSLIEADITKEILKTILVAIPDCETQRPGARIPWGSTEHAALSRAAKKPIEYWPSAEYHDELGNVSEWPSASALFKDLMGQDPSGSVCMIEADEATGQIKETCRSLSLVDSFNVAGFVVRGNGEPPPVTVGMSQREVTKAHLKARRYELLAFLKGKKPNVYGGLRYAIVS